MPISNICKEPGGIFGLGCMMWDCEEKPEIPMESKGPWKTTKAVSEGVSRSTEVAEFVQTGFGMALGPVLGWIKSIGLLIAEAMGIVKDAVTEPKPDAPRELKQKIHHLKNWILAKRVAMAAAALTAVVALIVSLPGLGWITALYSIAILLTSIGVYIVRREAEEIQRNLATKEVANDRRK